MTLERLFKALPSWVRVGPFRVEIHIEEIPGGALTLFGTYASDAHVIKLNPHTVISNRHLADTLVHEINHAIFDIYGLGEADGEERTVGVVSTAWIQVYGDNPWLLGWLSRALRS